MQSKTKRITIEVLPQDRLLRYTRGQIGRLLITEFNAIDLLVKVGEPYRLSNFGELTRRSEDAGTRRAYVWRKYGLLDEEVRPHSMDRSPVIYIMPSKLGLELYKEADWLLLASNDVRHKCEQWGRRADRWQRAERRVLRDAIRRERGMVA